MPAAARTPHWASPVMTPSITATLGGWAPRAGHGGEETLPTAQWSS